jgi:CRISPR-associated protein Cas5d
MNEIQVEIWGEFACYSRPEGKVERLTYPVITPSAARGVLSAIYSKPPEFYWQIKKIEVLNPIRYISFKRNEVINCKIGRETLNKSFNSLQNVV